MAEGAIDIRVEKADVINYAIYKNGFPVFQLIEIYNKTNQDLKNLTIQVISEKGLIKKYETHLSQLGANKSHKLNCDDISIDANILVSSSNTVEDTVYINVLAGDAKIASLSLSIIASAFDQWYGEDDYDSLASFAVPNYRVTGEILSKAESLLKQSDGQTFDGYLQDSVEQVELQAAVIFRALQEEAMGPSELSNNYLEGQRIRLADLLIASRRGSCLDLSLLYASCLERVGLHPLLFLKSNYVLAGVWLDDISFPEICNEDISIIKNNMSKGHRKIVAVDCLDIVRGLEITFDNSKKNANLVLNDTSNYKCCIDIYRARVSGIMPLPLRVKGENGFMIGADSTTAAAKFIKPMVDYTSSEYIEIESEQIGKEDLWERGLLDLSLRNSLLNTKIGARAIPLAVPSLEVFEEALSKGKSISLLPKLGDMKIPEKPTFEDVSIFESSAQLLNTELESRRVRAELDEADLSKTLRRVFRASQSSLEETGANTLYIAFGMLKWRDKKRNNQNHYAPLVLVPVDLIRKSVGNDYSIVIRDEDARFNISLLELLRKNFGISIGGLDPLPRNEDNIDIRLVLNTVINRIMGQEGWYVIESVVLGIFSFSQFIMWNDIHSHGADLRKSKIVESFIEGKLTWEAKPMAIPDNVDPAGVLLPIEADASQLFAIKEASLGVSFILHGPPGTGKSQTITGMIANALANNKKVLFVSEKAAALSVVQKRLNNIGLSPFCLEIYSNKVNKKHVLEQLEKATNAAGGYSDDKYQRMSHQISDLRLSLDSYVKALETINGAGLSLREQICRYEEYKDAPEGVDLDSTYLNRIDSPEALDKNFQEIDSIVASIKDINNIRNHPLAFVTGSNFSQHMRFSLNGEIVAMRKALNKLQESGIDFCESIQISMPSTYAEWMNLQVILETLQKGEYSRTDWDENTDFQSLVESINDAAKKYSEFERIQETLSERWEDAAYELPIEQIQEDWGSRVDQNFFKRARIKKSTIAALSKRSKHSEFIDEYSVDSSIHELLSYKISKDEYENAVKTVLIEQPSFVRPLNENGWTDAINETDKLQKWVSEISSLTGNRSAAKRYLTNESKEKGTALEESIKNLRMSQSSLEFLIGVINIEPNDKYIEFLLQCCDMLEQHQDLLHEWMNWRRIESDAIEKGLNPVLIAFQNGMTPDNLLPSYKRALYKMMCCESFDSNELANTFTGAQFEKTIEQYKNADNQLRNLARQEIRLRLAKRVPNMTSAAAQGTEAGKLQRAIRSHGRGVSIRELFSEVSDLILRMCPCLLMSPLSVAQYLDIKKKQFDLVIFDEASQLQTCKAVGALARAENAIIVGDPLQMPPTTFFQGRSDDEDFQDIADLESLLDDCLALNLPQTKLQWHYRSRHESLIAFSNVEFYGGELYTFPSADDQTSKVIFHKVDGIYNKGTTRTNEAEAHAIIKNLIRRSEDEYLRNQSVGVVTFNVQQQELIDDLFQNECAGNKHLQDWVQNSIEPVFIKNLENVQGDERDVILFSITYAKDNNGKMIMNFGPLNSNGGERRLNVAVTRAREEMEVFSSVEPEDIDVRRTKTRGVKSLRDFLKYAKSSTLNLDKDAYSSASVKTWQDSIADSICEALSANGYRFNKNIGKSSYRIDIGVLDPEDFTQYLCGIVLDGEYYLEAQSTRDREITRMGVLENLGWDLFRIWSVEWWEHSEKVIGELLEHLKFLREQRIKKNPTLRDSDTEYLQCIQAYAMKEDEASIEDCENETSGADEDFKAPTESQEFIYDYSGIPRVKIDVSKSASSSEIELNYSDITSSSDEHALSNINDSQKNNQIDNYDIYYVAKFPPLPKLTAKEYLDYRNENMILARFEKVIEIEAPIEERLLSHHVLNSFGLSKEGSRLLPRDNALLKKVKNHRTSKNGYKTIIWRADQNPKGYDKCRKPQNDQEKRDVDQIPWEEISAAAVKLLALNGSLQELPLAKEIANYFGYIGTEKAINCMVKGIHYARAMNKIIFDNGWFVLP